MPSRHLFAVLLPLTSLLTGCEMVVMSPSGDVAAQQRDLIVIATVLMLLIVVPVMALTGWFAWRYRQGNTKATYAPDWHHSTQLELVIWSAPLLIIIALGAVTWITTHTLDPYRKLTRIEPGRPVTADVKPLKVQVVALDWKWLFIYPDYGIATVNRPSGCAHRVRADRLHGDEHLLRAGTRGDDLHHARHANQVACSDQRAR